MQEQWIIRWGLGWFGSDETGPERNSHRLDGCNQGHRIPAVRVNGPETEAHGMEVQVLSHGMMVVVVLRRVLLLGTVDRSMVMVGMRLMRRMRLGMLNIDVPMGRDLKQVRQSQGQNHARPERERKSGEHDFHSPERLTPESLSVNLAGFVLQDRHTIRLLWDEISGV